MKHENYELLNLLGYGLAKFDNDFIKEFDCKNKQEFYNIFVKQGIVKTASVVKNRMDLFDYFFPENPRKGWWQKGDAYIHRKKLIDSMFGDESVKDFAQIVKIFLRDKYKIELDSKIKESKKSSAILQTKFKQMQSTGLEAEVFFINNYSTIAMLKDSKIIDARIYGDGYDFLAQTKDDEFLCEIKGIRAKQGSLRLTKNEFIKADEFGENYLLVAVLNLQEIPLFKVVSNPLKNLKFIEKTINTTSTEYHLQGVLNG